MESRRLPEPPPYVCKRADSSVTIDGRLDEPAWAKAQTILLRLTDRGETPMQATEVRALWDDDYLYVGFQCSDTDIRATIAEHDGELWEEEVVEVFIDDDSDGKTYVEYEINPLNALVDLYVVNRTGRREDVRFMLDWNSDGIRHAVTTDGDPTRRGTTDRSWTVEWAIPFTDLATLPNSPPKNGDTLRINFYRIERGRDGEEYSAWSPTGEINFHVPSRFGTLVFSVD